MSRPDASAKIAAAAPKNSNRALLAILVTAAIVAGIAVAVFVAVGSSRTSPTGTGGVPKGATALGGPIVLNPDAPAGVPVLDLYEDPQCPACKIFEDYYGATLNDLVKTNKAKVRVHTLSFLDTNLKNDSSVRAANGAFCAADQGKFYDYMAQVYANQPAKEGTGYPAEQLTSFAVKAGVADQQAWASCQAGLTYQAHTLALETNTEKSGVNGTPTVKVAGQTLKLTGNPADITDAVKAATK